MGHCRLVTLPRYFYASVHFWKKKISSCTIKLVIADSCTDINDHVLIFAGSDLLDDEEDTPTS